KSLNQTKGLRQRGSALEQEARSLDWPSVKQRIECPAHPEVFLDVLLGRADSPSGRDEEVATIAWRGGDDAFVVGLHAVARLDRRFCLRVVPRWSSMSGRTICCIQM